MYLTIHGLADILIFTAVFNLLYTAPTAKSFDIVSSSKSNFLLLTIIRAFKFKNQISKRLSRIFSHLCVYITYSISDQRKGKHIFM